MNVYVIIALLCVAFFLFMSWIYIGHTKAIRYILSKDYIFYHLPSKDVLSLIKTSSIKGCYSVINIRSYILDMIMYYEFTYSITPWEFKSYLLDIVSDNEFNKDIIESLIDVLFSEYSQEIRSYLLTEVLSLYEEYNNMENVYHVVNSWSHNSYINPVNRIYEGLSNI